jgi:hypothetical protein
MDEDVSENAQLETQQVDELFPKTNERSEIYYTLALCYCSEVRIRLLWIFWGNFRKTENSVY